MNDLQTIVALNRVEVLKAQASHVTRVGRKARRKLGWDVSPESWASNTWFVDRQITIDNSVGVWVVDGGERFYIPTTATGDRAIIRHLGGPELLIRPDEILEDVRAAKRGIYAERGGIQFIPDAYPERLELI